MESNSGNRTFKCIAKVQNAHPIHQSDLINKELGSNVVVENTQNKVIITDAVSSERNNSELFKRIEKQLINNVRNKNNQLLLFSGTDRNTRLETSIGASNNPGFFLLTAISLLDEKYKQHYQTTDLHLSIMQYKQGAIYDLLSYTNTPLCILEDRHHCTHFDAFTANFTTFSHFLKLFKIAIFYNQERDFKNKALSKNTSTFIMKFIVKSYDYKNQLLSSQQTLLVDIENQIFNAGSKDKFCSLFDSIIRQYTHSQPSSLNTRKNPFFRLINPYTAKDNMGEIIFVHTISAKASLFKQHQNVWQTIRSAIDIRQSKQKNIIKKKVSLLSISSLLKIYLQQFKQKSYTSIRTFQSNKINLITNIKNCKTLFQIAIALIKTCLKQKSKLKLFQTDLLKDQINLIGCSVKTDSWKDFYQAKSYIQLSRQIFIKTQKTQFNIIFQYSYLYDIEKKIKNLFKNKMKQQPFLQDLNQQKNNKLPHLFLKNKQNVSALKHNSIQKNKKFKKIQNKYVEEKILFEEIEKYFYNFIQDLWERVRILHERTLFDDIFLQQNILLQEANTLKLLNQFLQQIQQTTNKQICFQQQNNKFISHSLCMLQKKQKKLNVKKLKTKAFNLQKNQRWTVKKQSTTSQKLLVNGRFKLSQCLLDPNQIKQ